ncbi:MAG: sigma-70 family RNA polymerase sigma factor [Muribaculaceae bacterium]|nr:sigma-70 family RNA polymerase sigma factor [Muribaculaceae bacterium]
MMTEIAFKHIATKLRNIAYTTAIACGVSEIEADDVAQDVMLKLWTMLDELDRYRSLESLVVVMTRHLTTSIFRKTHAVALNTEAYLAITNLASPQERLEEIENENWLMQHLNELPPKQYSVLKMRHVEHRSYREIAELMGITETSARSLIARARESLFKDYNKWI